jgi:hypothetical protein
MPVQEAITTAGDSVRILTKAALLIPGDGLPSAGLYAFLYARTKSKRHANNEQDASGGPLAANQAVHRAEWGAGSTRSANDTGIANFRLAQR